MSLLYDYKVGTVSLNCPESISDIDVTSDSKLLFMHHINQIVSSSHKTLGSILKNMKDFKDHSNCILSFYIVICSKFDYASIL